MTYLERIETALGIEVNRIQGYIVQRLLISPTTPLTQETVAAGALSGKYEWQDSKRPDCGLNDGGLYIYLPAVEDANEDDESNEMFVAIWLDESIVSFC